MTHRIARAEAVLIGIPAGLLAAAAFLVAVEVDAMLPLVVALELLVVTLAALRPLAALYLSLLAAPFEAYTSATGVFLGLTALQALLLLTAFTWAGRRILTRQPVIAESPLTAPFALVLVTILPGLLISPAPDAVAKTLGTWLAFFLVVQMILQEGNRVTVRNLLITVGCAGAILGAIALVTGAPEITSGQTTGRPTAAYGNANILALYIGVAIPCQIGLALRGPPLLRPASVVALVVSVIGLTQTLSRTGLVATAGAVLLLLAWRPFGRIAAAAAITVVLALASGINPLESVIPNATVVTDRITSLTYGLSSNPRLVLYDKSPDMIADHPIFGVGANSYQLAAPQYGIFDIGSGRVPVEAHNMVLNLAAERGLLGLAAFAWLLVVVARVIVTSCRKTSGEDQAFAFAIAGSWLTIMLWGLADSVLSWNSVTVVAFAFTACAVVLGRDVPTAPRDVPPGSEQGPRGAMGGSPAAAVVPSRPRDNGDPKAATRLRSAAPGSRMRASTQAATKSRVSGTDVTTPQSDELTAPVTFISSTAEFGGAEEQMLTILEGIGHPGVESVILLGDGPVAEALRSAGYTTRVIDAPPRAGLVLAAYRLRRTLGRSPGRVVHANGVRAAITAALATIGSSHRVVWLKVDCGRDGLVARLLARRCDQIVGVSHTVNQTFRGRAQNRLRVVYPGLRRDNPDRGEARKLVTDLIGCAADAEVLLLSGRLCPPKGQRELIELTPRLASERPKLRIALLGGETSTYAGYEAELKERARVLGVSSVVSFLGHHPPAVALRCAAGADLLVAPSRRQPEDGWREGFGFAPVEAMSAGTPVVAYSHGSFPEVLGDCAYLVPEGDTQALATAIVEVLSQDEIRARLVACGSARAGRYTIEAMVAGMKRAYAEAASRIKGLPSY